MCNFAIEKRKNSNKFSQFQRITHRPERGRNREQTIAKINE